MIEKRNYLIWGIILFIISFILDFPFPNASPYGETIFKSVGLPVYSNPESQEGILFVGITSFILFFVSLYLLNNSFKKYNIRIVLSLFVFGIAGSHLLIYTYQNTIATGIYAIGYEEEFSRCEFETSKDGKKLNGKCYILLANYSSKEAQFTLKFKTTDIDDPYDFNQLMNRNGPYELNLYGHEKKIIEIETAIDVTKIKEHPESGEANGMGIVLFENDRKREL
ncbi:hypothetical protein [Bacillus sp. CECT 9360]|uniref:hypothetical protein n=1 Tax=Bacillus sp. CECT 9360 TaxID=2845821 RepID=UPI001E50E3B6|nr:hypothetical protein [Bacillus sp. CECT 9360]CAH0346629.1 hypothetical protein BCI9360_02972 [Bacillus sp. CECT 9360]